MKSKTARVLRRDVVNILEKQGYVVSGRTFCLNSNSRDSQRAAHSVTRAEKLHNKLDFIGDNMDLIKSHLVNGKDLDVRKIEPVLKLVDSDTQDEAIFRWWNMVWWSLPPEQAYGRQMRILVWDKYHDAPIGLIGLQSPILSWSVRDKYLEIAQENRDYWINQSMSAQRLGALPPYSNVLGGKLVASLMTTDWVRRKFREKYASTETLMLNRKIPARLLFITTTGAFGKSSVYNRLKFNDEEVCKFIGYTHGSGSFHIPDSLYERLMLFMQERNIDVQRGYGNGPSRKLKLIRQALDLLGFEDGNKHGIQRALYLFPLTTNLKDIISHDARPKWIHRDVNEVTDFWKERWSLPREERKVDFKLRSFVKKTFDQIELLKTFTIHSDA